MITGGSTLDPGFPTWGTMLREHGYHTSWYGKWHLTHGDHTWNAARGQIALEELRLRGRHLPLARRRPRPGLARGPADRRPVRGLVRATSGKEPWCTTVSFVNPHDIAWWYKWSDRVPAEAQAPSVIRRLPPNFETPELLIERNKPLLQRSFQDTAAASFGPVPFTGPEVARAFGCGSSTSTSSSSTRWTAISAASCERLRAAPRWRRTR